jgi:serine/threonine protein kinase
MVDIVDSTCSDPYNISPSRPQRLAHILPYIPFETILQATNGLSDIHLLSSTSVTGRLFSGMHPDGTLIVVREVEYTDTFEAVISRAACLRHPNVALLMGFSVGSSEPYKSKRFLIYEFLSGGGLRDRKFHVQQQIEILCVVCGALFAASSRGIFHGGISDSNILLDEHGNPKITDFHVAALNFQPSLASDLRDFALLLRSCSSDWPEIKRRATQLLADRIDLGHFSDFRLVQGELGKILVAEGEEGERQVCDEAVQTEPLLPVGNSGCCVIM